VAQAVLVAQEVRAAPAVPEASAALVVRAVPEARVAPGAP
jgi:hypothetical protein